MLPADVAADALNAALSALGMLEPPAVLEVLAALEVLLVPDGLKENALPPLRALEAMLAAGVPLLP